ncbi:MAG: putative zinc-binding metallopeptidase [Paludibacteraceae bacterium]
MKKIFQVIAIVGILAGLAACDRDGLNPDSIFVDPPTEDTTTYTYQFDRWLYKHFTEPYNVEFIYKLDDNGTDASYNIVPVSIGMADTLAHLALYLWYDVYDSIAGKDFLPQYGPKKLKLIGSSMINAALGTEKLGYAEGGIQITLLKINLMETNNIEQLNEYIFKTMHHEFSHILHQQKAYPPEYGLINPQDYNPSRWQDRTDEEAWKLGFVSNYGSSQTREDFVEVIANYIVKPDAEWQNMLTKAGPEGAAIINQKWELCSTWLQEKWNIDLVAMHKEVQKRQENLDWDMIMNLEFLKK